jgi:hypothetical protein
MVMKKNLYLLSWLIMAAFVGLGITSCNKDDDDPEPEIVTDKEVYYIVGEVVSNGNPVEGVKVATGDKDMTTGTDGVFKLEVEKKGDYTVAFSKSGYVSVNTYALIASGAKNKASFAIKQELTKKKDPVKVTPDEEKDITDEEKGVTLHIPEGALKNATDIVMTPFTPGESKIATNGAVSASLISLYLEPDGLTFEKPVELLLKNPMGDRVAFDNMKHIVEKSDGKKEEIGDIEYDKDKNCYKAMLTGFSNHSLEITTNASSGGTGTEAIATEIIDNLGYPAATSKSVSISQKYGWTMIGDVKSSLKSQYPGLQDATIEALASNITSAVSSLMGSAQGTGELSLTTPFNVSGDTKLTFEVQAQTETKKFSFPLIFADGGSQRFEVSAKKYTGTEIKTTYQYGNTHTDHSGGSGQ